MAKLSSEQKENLIVRVQEYEFLHNPKHRHAKENHMRDMACR